MEILGLLFFDRELALVARSHGGLGFAIYYIIPFVSVHLFLFPAFKLQRLLWRSLSDPSDARPFMKSFSNSSSMMFCSSKIIPDHNIVRENWQGQRSSLHLGILFDLPDHEFHAGLGIFTGVVPSNYKETGNETWNTKTVQSMLFGAFMCHMLLCGLDNTLLS